MQYRPLTDSFRELNRMLMEKQSWDAAQKNQEAKIGLEGLVAESQLKTAFQQQQLTEFKLEEQRRLNTPTAFNVNKVLPGGPAMMQDFANNPAWVEDLKRMTIDGDEQELARWRLNPADGTFRDENNQPFQMSPKVMGERMPWILGVHSGHFDTVGKTMEAHGRIVQQIKEVDKQIAAGKKDKYAAIGATDKGPSMRLADLHKQRAQLIQAGKQAEMATSPKGIYQAYTAQMQMQQQLATRAAGLGNEALANYFTTMARDTAASRTVAMQKMFEEDKEILKSLSAAKAQEAEFAHEKEMQDIKHEDKMEEVTAKIKSDESIADAEMTLESVTSAKELALKEDIAIMETNAKLEIAANKITAEQEAAGEGGSQAGEGGMTSTQAVKKIADDIKSAHPMGEMTAEAMKPVRDLATEFINNYAIEHNIGPKGNYFPAYAAFVKAYAVGNSKYWSFNKEIKNKKPEELLALFTPEEIKEEGVNEKNVIQYFEMQNKRNYKDLFRPYVGDDYPIPSPSKIRQQMRTIGR